jgi:GR25 family glycosyltransferase involved in LPS biosynthesis
MLAYTKQYLKNHSYNEDSVLNEEKDFTNNFSEDLISFEGVDLGIHIAHSSNTVSKLKHFKRKAHLNKFDITNLICDPVALQFIESFTNGNSLNFKWINLEKDTERKVHMISQFDIYNFNNSRFQARTPEQIKYQALPYTINKTSPEEFACMCSHLEAIYETLENSNDEHILILEDDIRFQKNVKNIKSIIANAPPDWQILQLHHVNFKNVQVNAHAWSRWRKDNFCTTFYVIKRAAASKLMQMYLGNSEGGLMFDFRRCKEPVRADDYIFRNFTTYTLNIPLASTETAFGTNIQKNDWEIKKKLISHFEAVRSSTR